MILYLMNKMFYYLKGERINLNSKFSGEKMAFKKITILGQFRAQNFVYSKGYPQESWQNRERKEESFAQTAEIGTWAKLFKTNNVVS